MFTLLYFTLLFLYRAPLRAGTANIGYIRPYRVSQLDLDFTAYMTEYAEISRKF